MNKSDVYGPGKNLASLQAWDSDAAFCIYTARNVPLPGVIGFLTRKKMAHFRGHDFAFGCVPMDDDSDPCVDVEICEACSSTQEPTIHEPTVQMLKALTTSTSNHPPSRKFNASSGLESGTVELSEERRRPMIGRHRMRLY